jgi:hypothetical protein
MNNEVRKLEELFDLTSHPGWKYMIEDMVERIDVMKETLTRNEVTPYELGVIQGHIKVYRELEALRRMIEVAMKQAAEDASEQVANV